MKSLSIADLTAIKEKMKNQVTIREGGNTVRVVVGMGTCGIAAGARSVLASFVENIAKEGLDSKVVVYQTGCAGSCACEPIVDVIEEGKEKVTYVNMTAEKAAEVVAKHLVSGTVVEQYTMNAGK